MNNSKTNLPYRLKRHHIYTYTTKQSEHRANAQLGISKYYIQVIIVKLRNNLAHTPIINKTTAPQSIAVLSR